MPIHKYIRLKIHEFGLVVCIDSDVWNCEFLHVSGIGMCTGDRRVAAANTDIHSNPLTYVPSSEVVLHFVFRSQTQYMKTSAQIRLCDAEDVFEFINSHDHELTLNDLLIFGSQVQMTSLRSLSLSLRRVPWRLRSCLRGLDSLKPVIKVSGGHWFERATNSQFLEKELRGCLPAARRFCRRRGFCLAKLH